MLKGIEFFKSQNRKEADLQSCVSKLLEKHMKVCFRLSVSDLCTQTFRCVHQASDLLFRFQMTLLRLCCWIAAHISFYGWHSAARQSIGDGLLHKKVTCSSTDTVLSMLLKRYAKLEFCQFYLMTQFDPRMSCRWGAFGDYGVGRLPCKTKSSV